jgi:hypothetical protein
LAFQTCPQTVSPPSYEEALDWAYDEFGLEGSFFVKLVAADQNVALHP